MSVLLMCLLWSSLPRFSRAIRATVVGLLVAIFSCGRQLCWPASHSLRTLSCCRSAVICLCALTEETWGLDWSPDEVEAFKELYITHGKDFRAIAQHLPQRTPAEAMMFYYRCGAGRA